jgi:hypothetical protein
MAEMAGDWAQRAVLEQREAEGRNGEGYTCGAMGRPKDVTVSLKDLRALARIMVAYSIESRAHALIRKSQTPTNKPAVDRYMAALRVVIPRAKQERLAQFGDLLEGLKSEDSARRALATFVDREARSKGASGT